MVNLPSGEALRLNSLRKASSSVMSALSSWDLTHFRQGFDGHRTPLREIGQGALGVQAGKLAGGGGGGGRTAAGQALHGGAYERAHILFADPSGRTRPLNLVDIHAEFAGQTANRGSGGRDGVAGTDPGQVGCRVDGGIGRRCRRGCRRGRRQGFDRRGRCGRRCLGFFGLGFLGLGLRGSIRDRGRSAPRGLTHHDDRTHGHGVAFAHLDLGDHPIEG